MPAQGSALGELRRRVRVNLNQSSPPSDSTLPWQNSDINDFINETITEITPGISIGDTISSGYLTVTGQYIYPVSATNFFRLTNVEVWNSGNSTKLGRVDNWESREVSGALNLVFRDPFDTSDYVLRLQGMKRIPQLSADGVSSEVNVDIEHVITLGATAKCFRAMYSDRIQFRRLLSTIDNQDGKMRDITSAVRDFQLEYEKRLLDLSIPGGNSLSYIGIE